MKRLLLLTLIIIISSCNSSKPDFVGIDGLKLGAEFNELSSSELFTKVKDDEYSLCRHTLANQIGSVSDLTVKTENGKISMISFTTNDETNVTALSDAMKNYMQNPVDIEPETIKLYQSTNNTSLLVFPLKRLEDHKQHLTYMYLQQNERH